MMSAEEMSRTVDADVEGADVERDLKAKVERLMAFLGADELQALADKAEELFNSVA